MNDIFFTSDEHYGHQRIIDFCKRPFGSVSEMNEAMVEQHNHVVKPGSRVYHLGDMFFKATESEALRIMSRLNGQHYLIVGNHDQLITDTSKELRDKFIWVKDFFELKVDGLPISLFHYPIRSWKRKEHGAWHLYGHVHGRFDSFPYGMSCDVGVDSWNFTPVSFEQLKEKFKPLEAPEMYRPGRCIE